MAASSLSDDDNDDWVLMESTASLGDDRGETFGRENGEELINKQTILDDIDRALGATGPPALELVFTEPYALTSMMNLTTNPYGHIGVRYTHPRTGKSVVMNVVGFAKNTPMINFVDAADFYFGTCEWAGANEQGGVYNRTFHSIRIERLPALAIERLHEAYVALHKRWKGGEACYSLIMSPIRNWLAGEESAGNCAFWVSLGMLQAGLVHETSVWPKRLFINVFELWARAEQMQLVSNVHIVAYHRIDGAHSYGAGYDATSWVRPGSWRATRLYKSLSSLADVSVRVPPGSRRAVVVHHPDAHAQRIASLGLQPRPWQLSIRPSALSPKAINLFATHAWQPTPFVIVSDSDSDSFAHASSSSAAAPASLSSSDEPAPHASGATVRRIAVYGSRASARLWVLDSSGAIHWRACGTDDEAASGVPPQWISLDDTVGPSSRSSSSCSHRDRMVSHPDRVLKRHTAHARRRQMMKRRRSIDGNRAGVAASMAATVAAEKLRAGGALLSTSPLAAASSSARVLPCERRRMESASESASGADARPKAFVDFSVGVDGVVFALDGDARLFCRFPRGDDGWHRVALPVHVRAVLSLSVVDAEDIWLVAADDALAYSLYHCTLRDGWTAIAVALGGTDRLEQVSAARDGNRVWALTASGQVLLRGGVDGQWRAVECSTPLERVAAGSDEHVWGVCDGLAYVWNGSAFESLSNAADAQLVDVAVSSRGVAFGVCALTSAAIFALSTRRVQVRCATDFVKLWDDRDSGAEPYQLSVWQPSVGADESYKPLGDLAERSNAPLPAGSSLLVRELFDSTWPRDDALAQLPPLLAAPVDYELVWRSASALPNASFGYHCCIWRPVAPERYRVVGYVVNRGTAKPSPDRVRCLHRSVCARARIFPEYVWRAGATGIAIWLNVGDDPTTPFPGTFHVSESSKQAPHPSALCTLKQSSF
jgi:Vacuolar protein sorting-associated protein 62